MQIGDQVRFLNEVGGGRITGFQGKDIVLIEDADGFDIPMLRSQVVVIETNANNFERKKKEEEKPFAYVVPEPEPPMLHDSGGSVKYGTGNGMEHILQIMVDEPHAELHGPHLTLPAYKNTLLHNKTIISAIVIITLIIFIIRNNLIIIFIFINAITYFKISKNRTT